MSKVEVLSLGEAIEKGVIKPYCDKFKRYIHETYGLISDCSPYNRSIIIHLLTLTP